jgi:hypothetical protein
LDLPAPLGLSQWAADGVDVVPAVEAVGRVLRSALDGEVRGLLSVASLVPEGIPTTEFVAAVAIETAGAIADGDGQGELTRLASDLVAVERMVGAIGLTRDRQLVSTLLKWYGELPAAG